MEEKDNKNHKQTRTNPVKQWWLKLKSLTAADLYQGPKAWQDRRAGSIWRYLADMVRMFVHFDLSSKAAAITYSLLFALVPTLLLILMLLASIGPSFIKGTEIINQLTNMVPEPVYETIKLYLPKINLTPSTSALVITLVLFSWAASQGFGQIFSSIVAIYPPKKTGFSLPGRLVGLVLTILLMAFLFLTIIILSFGRAALELINRHWHLITLSAGQTNIILGLIGTSLLSLMFYGIYRFAAKRSSLEIPAMPGAIFAAGSWTLLSLVYSWYISSRTAWASIYGGLTNLVILLLWLNLSSLLVLIGSLINYRWAWTRIRKDKKDLLADHLQAGLSPDYLPEEEKD